MIWKITAFNGTVWVSQYKFLPEEAIAIFLKRYGLSYADIKTIENLS